MGVVVGSITCPLCKTPNTDVSIRNDGSTYSFSCKLCHNFLTDKTFLSLAESFGKLPLLSGVARHHAENGKQLVVNAANWEQLQRLAPTLITDQVRSILQYFGSRTKSIGGYCDYNPEFDYPIGYLRDTEEFIFAVEHLRLRKLILLHMNSFSPRCTLTIEGWSAIERASTVLSDKAFVAMWFDARMNDAYFVGIEPALTSLGYRSIRVDNVEHVGKIDDRIVAEIKESRFLVADFTGHRGGVYFESGFAMGIGLPVVWTCHKKDISKLHFDIRQYSCVVWETPEELREKLTNRIRATIGRRLV